MGGPGRTTRGRGGDRVCGRVARGGHRAGHRLSGRAGRRPRRPGHDRRQGEPALDRHGPARHRDRAAGVRALLPVPGDPLPPAAPGHRGPADPARPGAARGCLDPRPGRSRLDRVGLHRVGRDRGRGGGGARGEPARRPQRRRSRGGRRWDAGAGALPRAREPQRHAIGNPEPLHGNHRDHHGGAAGAAADTPADRPDLLARRAGGALPRPLARRARTGLGERRGGAVALGRAAARARRSASGCAISRSRRPDPAPRGRARGGRAPGLAEAQAQAARASRAPLRPSPQPPCRWCARRRG